jgi:O-antigen/teichoic acid export membrane protein
MTSGPGEPLLKSSASTLPPVHEEGEVLCSTVDETAVSACARNTDLSAVLENPEIQVWEPAAVAKDIATLGTGTLIAAVINTALVFVIPRLVSIEDYGYWRLFALYAGYVGSLHFGFLDGALLRWAGKPFSSFHREIRPSMRFLLLQQLAIVAPLCLVCWIALPPGLRFIAIAVVLYSFVINPLALLQYALQSARRFHPVAISTILGPGLLLCAVLVLTWGFRQPLDFHELIVLYFFAWFMAFGFLCLRAKPWIGQDRAPDGMAKQCMLAGWPIVAANTVAVLSHNLDRLVLSWTGNIHNFAQYSLAASAMAVPVTAIQASSKVLFPHLAGLPSEDRQRVYGAASRSLLLAWGLLLPYYFALEVFVRHVLPKYIPSLPIARILLLGIIFIAGIQILQASFAYLYGRQVLYLRRTIVILALGTGLAFLAAFKFRSLEVVAGSQVLILALWWLSNEWSLRDLTRQRLADWTKFVGLFVFLCVSYFFAIWITPRRPIISLLIYYLFAGSILSVFLRDDFRVWSKVLRR